MRVHTPVTLWAIKDWGRGSEGPEKATLWQSGLWRPKGGFLMEKVSLVCSVRSCISTRSRVTTAARDLGTAGLEGSVARAQGEPRTTPPQAGERGVGMGGDREGVKATLGLGSERGAENNQGSRLGPRARARLWLQVQGGRVGGFGL